MGGIDRINVQNNPVNWVDPYGLWTLAVDFSATAGAGGGSTAGHTYMIDSSLNIARVEHAGGGGYSGIGAGVAAQIQATNAPTVYNLAGGSVSVGGSVGPGVQGTGELVIMDNGYWGVNAGIAADPGTPIELHGMYEISNVAWSGNLFNLALDWLINQFFQQDGTCK